MTIGEPRPKSLRSLEDLGLATDGHIVDFLAGVWVDAGVAVVGDMGRLRFLDPLAGWFSDCTGVGGTSLATVRSTFIVSESEDRLELVPKDGARLRDLEVAEAAKDSARFILWTRGLSGYSEAGSDELDNEENERRSPGCFCVAQLENRDEFSVEELGVEGLRDESWLLEADFFGDVDGRAYGWKGVFVTERSFRCKRCDSLPNFVSVSRGATTGGNHGSTNRLIL